MSSDQFKLAPKSHLLRRKATKPVVKKWENDVKQTISQKISMEKLGNISWKSRARRSFSTSLAKKGKKGIGKENQNTKGQGEKGHGKNSQDKIGQSINGLGNIG